VQKQIVPDDGEASQREQQHGMQEVRRHWEGGGGADTVRTSMITKHGCIYQDESQGEGG